MFKYRTHVDFSGDLREVDYWDVGNLKTLKFCQDAATMAVDPISRLLAVGTSEGVIHVLGAPEVHVEIKLPTPTPVKFLEFATNTYKLVCIDESDKLIIYDLTSLGQVKVEVVTRVERPVTSVSISPSHTHAFLSLESGEVKTYDILCRRFSTYSIPNAWDSYEKELQADGMIVESDGGSRIPSQVLVHPRNLGLVFIAYGGGVVLVDLKSRKKVRVYDMLIPAGAPGGAGYTDSHLLKHRRPAVTTMALHPSGHILVVGHIDGCFAFWAVESDEQPLIVRTLDEVDVNMINGDALDQYLPNGGKALPNHVAREPIFKLAWSGYPNSTDPRGGETSLAILGGQLPNDHSGINVLWLPAFNPHTAPPLPGDSSPGLHPHYRQAMRASVEVQDAYFYPTLGLTQDFLLVPRDNPHFSGSWDPSAILFLSESSANRRIVEAFSFPPPSFSSKEDGLQPVQQPVDSAGSGLVEQQLSDALRDLEASNQPDNLLLDSKLWNGHLGVVGITLVSVDIHVHGSLSSSITNDPPIFKLEGGIVLADEELVGRVKLSKFESRRLLITTHSNQTVSFLDVSAQLLIPPSDDGLVSSFPSLLPSLSVDPLSVISHPSICNRYHVDPQHLPTIKSVQFVAEALEMAVVLSTGACIFYHLSGGRISDKERHLDDLELASLEHVSVANGLCFHPFLMVLPIEPVHCFSHTSIGFAAVGYISGALSIIDMRGPKVVYREGADKKSRRHSLGSMLHKSPNGADMVESLTWTICGLHSDPWPKIRLVAIRASGHATVYNVARDDNGNWAISPALSTEMIQPLSTFVLDARLGSQLKADRSHLSLALDIERADADAKRADKDGHKCIFVVVGSKGARCYGDLDGDKRVGKVEWGTKTGLALTAQVVERTSSFVLVVVTDKQQAIVYSLPSLEYLHTFPLPTVSPTPPSMDSSGDLATLVYSLGTPPPSDMPAKGVALDSFFSAKRGYHDPKVSLTERKDGAHLKIPPQPQPVGLGPSSIFSGAEALFGGLMGTGTLTGAQIDAMFAGPDRPIPEKPVSRAERMKYVEWESPAKSTARAATGTQDSLYNRLQSALAERGDALNGLEENFNNLGQESKGMLDQAKRLAAEQSAKGWFARTFG